MARDAIPDQAEAPARLDEENLAALWESLWEDEGGVADMADMGVSLIEAGLADPVPMPIDGAHDPSPGAPRRSLGSPKFRAASP